VPKRIQVDHVLPAKQAGPSGDSLLEQGESDKTFQTIASKWSRRAPFFYKRPNARTALTRPVYTPISTTVLFRHYGLKEKGHLARACK